jgi:hypothetical protein
MMNNRRFCQSPLIKFSRPAIKKNANERPLVRTKRNRINDGTDRLSFLWKFLVNSPDNEKYTEKPAT